MDEPTRTLEARLRRLERQARLSRAAAAAAIVAAAGAWLAPEAAARRGPEAELQARRFVLVSGQGQPLAALESSPEGAPRLSLLRSGAARLALSLSADGWPALTLTDAAGAARAQLGVSAEGAQLSLAGAGRSRAALVNDVMAPRLALADAAGNDRIWVALRLGSPAIQFLDAEGRARSGFTTFNEDAGVAVISSVEKTAPGLVLYDKNRNIAWSAP